MTGSAPTFPEKTFQKTLMMHSISIHTGKGKRSFLEDFVLADREKGFFVVADGFGGPVSGAQAAKVACESVRTFLCKESGDQDATLPFVLRKYYSLAGNVLFNSLIHANRKVLALNRGKNVNEKGGASVLAGYLDGDLLALANVGLCSASLLRGGRKCELVMPRSYAKLKNAFLNRTASDESDVPLTALGISDDMEPEVTEYRLQSGDWLVAKTDGTSEELSSKLAELQQKVSSIEAVIRDSSTIIEKENSTDNIAVSLIIFG